MMIDGETIKNTCLMFIKEYHIIEVTFNLVSINLVSSISTFSIQ